MCIVLAPQQHPQSMKSLFSSFPLKNMDYVCNTHPMGWRWYPAQFPLTCFGVQQV